MGSNLLRWSYLGSSLKKLYKTHRESDFEKRSMFVDRHLLLHPCRTVGTIQHCLHLTSVYTHFLPQHGRPEVTTMPLGLGTTVDYIFFSAESCENRNRTGKPGGSWVHRSHPQKSLGTADSRSGVWSHGLGYWDLTRKVADFIPNLALVVLIIIPLGHLPAFSFCSIRERWADQPHLYLRGKSRAPGGKWILNKAAI